MQLFDIITIKEYIEELFELIKREITISTDTSFTSRIVAKLNNTANKKLGIQRKGISK